MHKLLFQHFQVTKTSYFYIILSNHIIILIDKLLTCKVHFIEFIQVDIDASYSF